MKKLKEWFLQVPWGKIALLSWGDPTGQPILLVHGRRDSAATFIPLLEHLPDIYHYVAMDIPGNGLSDPLPVGVALSRFFPVVVIDMVVNHLNWRDFIYVAHSMGTEIGLFYNSIYPERIKKFVLLDPGPALQRLVYSDFATFYKAHYEAYYSNYDRVNTHRPIYSKESALRAVMKARGLTWDQAEIVLSRNLKRIGDDQYILSWDHRQKLLAPMFNSPKYYFKLFSKNTPPSLLICATNSTGGYEGGRKAIAKLISDLEANVENFNVLRVEGGHDVHITNPERVCGDIKRFLKKDFKKKSKL